jgi:hypothetical protein
VVMLMRLVRGEAWAPMAKPRSATLSCRRASCETGKDQVPCEPEWVRVQGSGSPSEDWRASDPCALQDTCPRSTSAIMKSHRHCSTARWWLVMSGVEWGSADAPVDDILRV